MAKWKITNENKRRLVDLLEQEPKVSYWQVAAKLGIHDNTMSKYMRMPNDQQTEMIAQAIADVREEMAQNGMGR